MQLRDIALSAIITGVTIAIGLVILSQFQTVIYQVESGGNGGYGVAYLAVSNVSSAVGGLPSWLNIYVVAGAGFSILGLILAGMQFGRQD